MVARRDIQNGTVVMNIWSSSESTAHIPSVAATYCTIGVAECREGRLILAFDDGF